MPVPRSASEPARPPQVLPVSAPAPLPRWRREPYRVLFPLGVLLAWAGVSQWLLLLAGVGTFASGRVFHSIAQIQSFMMCFAAGFLLTMIPRRTGTPPAGPVLLGITIVAPIATTVGAGLGKFALAVSAWMVLVIALAAFAIRRLSSARAAGPPAPDSFVWVPLAFLTGIAGAVLTGFRMLGPEWIGLHTLGKDMLVQGMFLGLVLGVGGMLLPLITRGDAPPAAGASRTGHLARLAHVAMALALVASFWLESLGTAVSVQARAGLALRAGIVLAVLLVSSRIYRLPTLPGWNRRVVWLSAWLIPLGLGLAAAYPGNKQAGLHVMFIGGFALMAFAVALHVILAHGPDPQVGQGRPWQVPTYAGLFLLALGARIAMQFADQAHYFDLMGLATGCFLLGTVVWGSLAVPRILR